MKVKLEMGEFFQSLPWNFFKNLFNRNQRQNNRNKLRRISAELTQIKSNTNILNL